MFSSSGSMCLLVLLGVALAASCPVQYVSDNLKKIHGLVADELALRGPDVGARPLFSRVIKSINTSCQRVENLQLVNATLDVYMRIFSSILQQDGQQQQQHHAGRTGTLLEQLPDSQRSKVESAVTKMQQKMEAVKNHLRPQNHNRDDVFQELSEINKKVDEPTVQKKALAEFIEVFQMASVIGSHHC
uniref:Interleukin-5 n=1 Tax=Stegastes partitus TaxID=144197 RepID=A0A3B5B7X3_9TELE